MILIIISLLFKIPPSTNISIKSRWVLTPNCTLHCVSSNCRTMDCTNWYIMMVQLRWLDSTFTNRLGWRTKHSDYSGFLCMKAIIKLKWFLIRSKEMVWLLKYWFVVHHCMLVSNNWRIVLWNHIGKVHFIMKSIISRPSVTIAANIVKL